MALKGQIETFTGPAARRMSRVVSAPAGDLRLKDLGDNLTKQRLETIYTGGLTPDIPEKGEVNPAFDTISMSSSLGPPQKTTIVSFVIDENENENENGTSDGKGEKKKNNAVTVLLSMLYALVVTLVGTVYPISEALRGEWLNDHVVALFLVYLFTISSVFLIYLQVLLHFHNKGLQKKHKPAAPSVVVNPPDGDSETDKSGTSSTSRDTIDKASTSPNVMVYRRRRSTLSTSISVDDLGQVPREGNPSGFPDQDGQVNSDDASDLNEEIYEQISFQTQTATLGHEAASIYLRFGALIFGIGNLVLVALELEEYYSQNLEGCPDTPFIYPMIFQMIFLIVQTFFILKHTQVHIKKWKGIARFGLMHVLATNACMWVRILVREVREGVNGHHYSMFASSNDALGDNTTEHCKVNNNLLDQASPFLFPCVLEYSLICVAVMAGIFQGLYIRVSQDIIEIIRKTLQQKNANTHKMSDDNGHTGLFDKSHKGLYGGVLVMAGTIISIILFFYKLNSLHEERVAIRIFHITDLGIHVLLVIAVVLAQIKFFKLHYTLSRTNTIDNGLLVFSFSGLFLFEGFIVMSSIAALVYQDDMTPSDITQGWLGLSAAFLNIFQGLFQLVFVIDGLQRCSLKPEDQQNKPGRGYVTFVLISNVALWIFKTFQVKEVGLATQAAYFGNTPWAIIMNLNLPLMLFFRFHSSVCMADIWSSAYMAEHNDMGFQVLN